MSLTLCDPMDYRLPGTSVRGFLQARILEGVAIHFSRDLLNVWIEPRSLVLRANSLLSDSLEKRVTTHSSLFA